MTEAEWLAATDLGPMLEFLKGKASDRKSLLLAVAFSRRVSPFLRGDGDRGYPAVEVAERAADETATERAGWLAAERLLEAIWLAGDDLMSRALSGYCPILAFPHFSIENVARAAERAAAYSRQPAGSIAFPYSFDERSAAEQTAQAGLVRDIFGNPFHPVSLDPSWLTSTVVSIARGIYADRAFDRLPILADALQDAGCENTDILAHCRGDGPHSRGCWVVDLVLGKE
jgi:hypothetical protein